jgi:hypothetical protein
MSYWNWSKLENVRWRCHDRLRFPTDITKTLGSDKHCPLQWPLKVVDIPVTSIHGNHTGIPYCCYDLFPRTVAIEGAWSLSLGMPPSFSIFVEIVLSSSYAVSFTLWLIQFIRGTMVDMACSDQRLSSAGWSVFETLIKGWLIVAPFMPFVGG